MKIENSELENLRDKLAEEKRTLNVLRNQAAIEFAKTFFTDEKEWSSIVTESQTAGQPTEKILAQHALRYANALVCQIEKYPFETWPARRNNQELKREYKDARAADKARAKANKRSYRMVADGNQD